jgi:lysophospholipid acyltransferase (LPLAT)-like uncharacterized protein
MRIRLHRHPIGQAVLARLVASYIRLVHITGEFELRCDPATAELIRGQRPLIGAFWHGRMLMIQPAWATLVRHLGLTAPLQPYVISSAHADGRFIASATDRLGLKTVFGSTKKAGGLGLLRGALKVLAEGNIAVVTPDGPRGPRMRAKSGTIHMARLAGVPIVPVTFACRRQWLLSSWDRFVLPRPFDRGVFAFGRPLVFTRDSNPDAAGAELEHELNRLTSEVDRAVGREPVAPG